MFQDRLSDLSLLRIEIETAEQTIFTKAIDKFASSNAQRRHKFNIRLWICLNKIAFILLFL